MKRTRGEAKKGIRGGGGRVGWKGYFFAFLSFLAASLSCFLAGTVYTIASSSSKRKKAKAALFVVAVLPTSSSFVAVVVLVYSSLPTCVLTGRRHHGTL